jgi:phosphatidylserine decarboxylase
MPACLPKGIDTVMMRLRLLRDRLLLQEDLNFLLTNRVPRAALTRFVGWYSRLRSPWLTALSIRVWRLFTELDLSEAKQQRFESLQDCFVRELKPGARRIDTDPAVLASPCDAIVGACGAVQGTQVFQAKGFPYELTELFGGGPEARRWAAYYRDGTYVTLRLTSAMYHRFHAPHDCGLDEVTYIAGDTWNVNPIALQRIERLFCRNERALLPCRLDATGGPGGEAPVLMLVPVAAILVASIKLHALGQLLHPRYRGPDRIACRARYGRGEEMGWFQHGSTIIVFAPPGFTLCEGVQAGRRVRMGQRLMSLPPPRG